MNGRVTAGILGAALMGAAIAATPTVAADVAVGVSPGGIAFGYQDGYWDRQRNWHAWRNHDEHERWRTANREHYYDRRHDHDRHDHNKGWREHDRYWERR